MSHVPPVSLWPDPDALGAMTDLYQLTMIAGYQALGKAAERATFEMFVRGLPPHRSYLVFAGLEQAVGDLLRLAIRREQAEALRSWPVFTGVDPGFFDRLPELRFEGDLWAMPEGTVCFPGEPLIRVEAPLAQAQWVETYLLASIGYPTVVASKASRVVWAAAGRPVFDFGARRAPGAQAGLLAARAAYLAGCAGTSHVEAGLRLGIPCTGTMAHSWVESFDGELEAFDAFAKLFPGASTMLVDTYATESGVAHAGSISPPVQAIRLDSGDVADQAFRARAWLDAHGRPGVRIVASGDLNEDSIATLVGGGAPIDVFGVGTDLVISRDSPALPLVYKLVALGGSGRIKLSPNKRTYPLAKQVYRRRDSAGRLSGDLVAGADEAVDGEPLLVRVVRDGRLVEPLPGLDAIRARCASEVDALPEALLARDGAPEYPVSYSPLLQAECARLEARLRTPAT
jgi:nicotinate phosphoribosyltransferase